MKAMISQPMNGFTDEQIKATKESAVKFLKEKGYEVINTFFDEEWSKKENLEAEGVVNIPVKFLSKSIEKMSTVDAVYFCSGWEKARGCIIEHDIAKAYGLQIFIEQPELSDFTKLEGCEVGILSRRNCVRSSNVVIKKADGTYYQIPISIEELSN